MQNTKRRNLLVIALGVIAALLIGVGCVTLNKTSAFASADVADDGYDYYIFTKTTDESGNECYEVALDSAYRSSVELLIVPKEYNGLPVVSIADKGFYACTKLTRVILPNTIENIGDYAFARCTQLTRLSFANAKSIGSNAFAMCNNLGGLFIPYTVQSVGTNVLRNNANTLYIQKSAEDVQTQWSANWGLYYTGNIVYNADPVLIKMNIFYG